VTCLVATSCLQKCMSMLLWYTQTMGVRTLPLLSSMCGDKWALKKWNKSTVHLTTLWSVFLHEVGMVGTEKDFP